MDLLTLDAEVICLQSWRRVSDCQPSSNCSSSLSHVVLTSCPSHGRIPQAFQRPPSLMLSLRMTSKTKSNNSKTRSTNWPHRVVELFSQWLNSNAAVVGPHRDVGRFSRYALNALPRNVTQCWERLLPVAGLYAAGPNSPESSVKCSHPSSPFCISRRKKGK